jgi:hypothetical protein
VFVALNPGQLPARRGPQAEHAGRLRRAEEIETLSYRTVVELNAESRLAPQRRVATIARRPERAQRLAEERAGRTDRRQADRTSRTSRPRQPRDRGMVPMPADPIQPDQLHGDQQFRADLVAYLDSLPVTEWPSCWASCPAAASSRSSSAC